MTEMFALAAVWLALAILSTILANRLKVSMALIEICVGMAAGFVAERWLAPGALGTDETWLRFLAAAGAVLLTFGTISALYGLTHGIVSRQQYSLLVAVVIASAVVPTLVATFAFLPRHLLPGADILATERGADDDGLADE